MPLLTPTTCFKTCGEMRSKNLYENLRNAAQKQVQADMNGTYSSVIWKFISKQKPQQTHLSKDTFFAISIQLLCIRKYIFRISWWMAEEKRCNKNFEKTGSTKQNITVLLWPNHLHNTNVHTSVILDEQSLHFMFTCQSIRKKSSTKNDQI